MIKNPPEIIIRRMFPTAAMFRRTFGRYRDTILVKMECIVDHLSRLSKKTLDDGETVIVGLLNKQLADTLDLRLQARQSYFNVRARMARSCGHYLTA